MTTRHPPGRAASAGELDSRNEAFWEELCGTSLATELGLRGRSKETLDAFDDAYLRMYPYLSEYVDRFDLRGRGVLEIGLGYGTLGQVLAGRGANYFGVDIASGPVEMMRHRLQLVGRPADEQIIQASAADLPFDGGRCDFVFSIGCLHHTGALEASIREVFRVLKPGGTTVIMLYNAHSARRILRVLVANALHRLVGRKSHSAADVARMYDANRSGMPAPHTEFVSRKDVRRLFKDFEALEIRSRNADDVRFRGHRIVRRSRLLGTPIERWLGLDLYIVARRPGNTASPPPN